MKFTIALDGPAASGKGTISRALVEQFGFHYLDTGELYREVASRTLGRQPSGEEYIALAIEESSQLEPGFIPSEDLRSPEVSRFAALIAAIPEVRNSLLEMQRAFANLKDGAILDGRDIGTVICPDAEVKLFITASPQVRAQRRFAELSGKGIEISYEDVLEDVRQRDLRDMSRDQAPLKPAEDAKQIDTTEMAIEDAVAAAVALVETKLADRG